MEKYQLVLTESSDKTLNTFFAEEYNTEREELFNNNGSGEKIIAYFTLEDSLSALAILALNSLSDENDFGCKLEDFLTGLVRDIASLSKDHPS